MKKILLIISLFLTLASARAQAPQNWDQQRTEKVEALKIAFITQKLELSADEAQKFWPVYNRYETEIRQVMKDNKTNPDAIDNEEKILNVKKKYRTEFSKIIGLPKTTLLFNSEREFRGVLMRQLKGKDGDKGRQGDKHQ